MKKKILFVILILVLGIGITGLYFMYISPNVPVQNWSVYFSNLSTSVLNGTAEVPENPLIENTSLKSYDVLVSKSGDYATYTFDVVNDGSVDAKLENVIKVNPTCISLVIPADKEDEKIVCNNLEYSVTYTKNGKQVKVDDVIKAHSKENLTLKIGYKSGYSNPHHDVQIVLYDMTFVYNPEGQ